MMKGGLGNLMRQAQQMQETMKKAQQELAHLQVTGEAGAGLVRVVLNGQHEVQKVEIDPKLLSQDKDMLEDLVAAAFNDARTKADEVAGRELAAAQQGMGLPPGFKLPF